ncbi:uncharacterized protein LOC26526270 [Drosophila erecta]|uniref:Uncharacterized protein n=1 Tax=Drosophila erecta TaxID=7220 RepID=A0A0Q5VUL0_DROER|nr:uncharacterized protein LOC26526270 [Drosophila erecta]KQS61961.1 uncharacterized protein Dere_GG26446 [Drosophila erecta]
MNWFTNKCDESRLRFFPNLLTFKGERTYGADLMSADECYSFIKKNLKSRNAVEEEVLWKMPILLVCLGCIIVILFAFCFAFQCLITKLKSAKMPKQFEFDICEVERSRNQRPMDKASQSDRPRKKGKSCCTCVK